MLETIDGLKTYIGGVCFILNGVVHVGMAVYNGEPVDWTVVMVSIGAGFGIIGIGHKIEKQS